MFLVETSRDRPKSAPYLRLKISKKTSKCQSIFFYSTRKKFVEKRLTMSKTTERGNPLGFFNIYCVAKLQKIEGGPFGEFFPEKKRLAMPKKTERGTLWSRPVLYVTRGNFFSSVLWANGYNLASS